MRGRIELIAGCMFSGKSRLLLERLEAAQAAGRPVAVFKHASDDRYAAGQIATHDGRRAPAMPVSDGQQIDALAGAADLVLVDEAQFFAQDIVEAARRLADQGREVVLAGLDLDSWGQPFGPMPELEAVADTVTRTSGTCARCRAVATRTQRTLEVGEVTMIGGPGAYEPRCEACFAPPPAHLRR